MAIKLQTVAVSYLQVKDIVFIPQDCSFRTGIESVTQLRPKTMIHLFVIAKARHRSSSKTGVPSWIVSECFQLIKISKYGLYLRQFSILLHRFQAESSTPAIFLQTSHFEKKKGLPPTRCPSFLPRLQTAGTKPRTSM